MFEYSSQETNNGRGTPIEIDHLLRTIEALCLAQVDTGGAASVIYPARPEGNGKCIQNAETSQQVNRACETRAPVCRRYEDDGSHGQFAAFFYSSHEEDRRLWGLCAHMHISHRRRCNTSNMVFLLIYRVGDCLNKIWCSHDRYIRLVRARLRAGSTRGPTGASAPENMSLPLTPPHPPPPPRPRFSLFFFLLFFLFFL